MESYGNSLDYTDRIVVVTIVIVITVNPARRYLGEAVDMRQTSLKTY